MSFSASETLAGPPPDGLSAREEVVWELPKVDQLPIRNKRKRNPHLVFALGPITSTSSRWSFYAQRTLRSISLGNVSNGAMSLPLLLKAHGSRRVKVVVELL